jgi:metabolite-proton symporter
MAPNHAKLNGREEPKSEGTAKSISSERHSGRRVLIEAIIASTVGTTIEWYDFFLYGTAAATIFPQLFFPELNPFNRQIASFSTFTIGFIARPVGGILFGHLGDRIGRKSTLVITLLLMGISTVLIGFVPTYHQIGMAAPVLLTALRVVQGLGVGGEWGGAVLLALEFGHRGKRGLYASWPQAGVPLGLLTSSGVFYLIASIMPETSFTEWGWRLPFFVSGLLIAVGLFIRLRIMETPLFQILRNKHEVARAPLVEVIRHHWTEVVLAGGARFAENACFYLFSIYVLTYGHDVLGLERAMILWTVNVAALLEFFTMPLFGLLSDWVSRKAVCIAGCIALAGFAFPYYALLETRTPTLVSLAIILSLAVAHSLLYSVQGALIPELFGTRVRYTGASLGYQIASPFAGGLAPIIAASLVQAWPGQYWTLAVYIVVIAVISLVSVLLLAETSKKDISG